MYFFGCFANGSTSYNVWRFGFQFWHLLVLHSVDSVHVSVLLSSAFIISERYL